MQNVKRILILSAVSLFAALGVTAQSTGGIKGKVRNTSGDGIAGVTVTVRQKSEDIKTVKTNDSGEFGFDGLEAGLYNIVFERDGYSSGVAYNVEVKKKKTTDLSGRLILRTDQGTLVIIRGSVFDSVGRSLPGAKIEVEKIGADGSTRKVGSGVSTASGEFTFRQPAGAAHYRITASLKGIKQSKEIEVGEAAVYRLAISLDMEEK